MVVGEGRLPAAGQGPLCAGTLGFLLDPGRGAVESYCGGRERQSKARECHRRGRKSCGHFLLFKDQLGARTASPPFSGSPSSDTSKNSLAIYIMCSFTPQANVQYEPKKLSEVQHLMQSPHPPNTFLGVSPSNQRPVVFLTARENSKGEKCFLIWGYEESFFFWLRLDISPLACQLTSIIHMLLII